MDTRSREDRLFAKEIVVLPCKRDKTAVDRLRALRHDVTGLATIEAALDIRARFLLLRLIAKHDVFMYAIVERSVMEPLIDVLRAPDLYSCFVHGEASHESSAWLTVCASQRPFATSFPSICNAGIQ